MNGLQPVVYSINGPVITVEGATGFQMMEMVYVGEKRLIGEVINISSSRTTIQVYENTTSLSPGEPVPAGRSALPSARASFPTSLTGSNARST